MVRVAKAIQGMVMMKIVSLRVESHKRRRSRMRLD